MKGEITSLVKTILRGVFLFFNCPLLDKMLRKENHYCLFYNDSNFHKQVLFKNYINRLNHLGRIRNY